MRTFFTLSAGLAACGIAGLASAQNAVAEVPVEEKPIAVAKIDRNMNLTTPWYYYDHAVDQYPCGSTALYDSYFATSGGFPANDPLCNLGSGVRYSFGSTFCVGGTAEDMVMATCPALGAPAEHLDLLYRRNFIDPAWIVVVFPWEDWDGCNGPSNNYSGVIITYGGQSTGFFYSNVDLCTAGIALTMPTDGSGAMTQQYLSRYVSGTNFDFHTCGGPGLWSAHDACTMGGPDDFQALYDLDYDAAYATTECADLSNTGACPDPLQLAIGWWGFSGPSDCLVLTNTGYVAGASTTWTVSGGTPGQKGVVVYGFNAGNINLNGFDIAGRIWCAEIGIAGVNPSKIVGNPKILDANGEAAWTKTIPLNQQGNTILTQALGSDTCPDPCQSAVDSTTVI